MAYVLIAVPLELVPSVTEFIEQNKGSSAPASPNGASENGILNGWDADTITKAYNESPDGMVKILKHLASHADEEVPMDDLIPVVGGSYGWRSVAGTLGAFGRRCENRYGKSQFPWYYRDEDGRSRLKMPANVAAVIRDAAGI